MSRIIDNEKIVSKMFREKYSSYYIHIHTGIPIKEVYGYIERCEKVKADRKKALYEQRLADKATLDA